MPARRGSLLVPVWKEDEVRRQVERCGLEAWFAGMDGAQLLDLMHDVPYDMSALLRSSAGASGTLLRDDDEFATRSRDYSERRLKAIRQKLLSSLRERLGERHPPLPKKTLHKIMLERKLMRVAWSAVCKRDEAASCTGTIEDMEAVQPRPWRADAAEDRAGAARIVFEYARRHVKVEPARMATPQGIRDLTRAVDGLRFALSPGAVAACYAYESTDSPPGRELQAGGEDPLNGKIIFQLAARTLGTLVLEATKVALLGGGGDHRRAGLFPGGEDNPERRGSNSSDVLSTDALEKSSEPFSEAASTAAVSGPTSTTLHVSEAIRLLRSALCALSALCPEKKEIVATGSNGVGGRARSTAESGAVRQQLELVCNEVLIPLGFLLEHAVGKAILDPAFRTRVEVAVRGPFAALLYLLSWHDDNLVSLFATQRNVMVRAALHWLAPRQNTPSAESESLIRRNLVTVMWSFAKKKDRALQLVTPDMIHPLLNCLNLSENQRDVRFTAAGALEKILTHRSSLTMMPKDDLGSEITLSKRSFGSVGSSDETPPPALLAAILSKLVPTLGILLGVPDDKEDDDDEPAFTPSSGYLQLTLAACANLAYLAIACDKEQPEYSGWLAEQLHQHLLVEARKSSKPPSGDVTEVATSVPELQEPRVFYEALRLLWVLLRLRIHPSNRNDVAARSLFKATAQLDVECASAGVIFDNVPPDDLKLHFIQDLLRYVQSPEHDTAQQRDTEPLRAFACWTLAHYTCRPDECKHVTYQSAFIIVGKLVTDDGARSLFTVVKEAVNRGALILQQGYNDATAKLLTLRLLARCMRNLAQSEITATLVVEHTKLGTVSALHALNRLAWLGWCLEEQEQIVDISKRAPTTYLTTGGHYFQELASHEVTVDSTTGVAYHKCVPIVIRIDHTDPELKRRVRQAATDERVRFDSTSDDHQVKTGCVPNTIRVLQEVAKTLESLAAHNQVRGFFGTHGTLALVVKLALHERFSSGVAFRVLLDTPRSALINHVVMSNSIHQPGGGERELFLPSPSNKMRRSNKLHPRWLVADIHELILRTLEKAPEASVAEASGGAAESDFQVAALLALQLATTMLANDDTKVRTLAQSGLQEGFRGKQVVVFFPDTDELVTGTCLKLLGPTTQATIDVILDSGDVHYGVPVKYVTMSELADPKSPARSASTSSYFGAAKNGEEMVAYFVHPSQFGSRNVETSLFSYFVRESDRFFTALDRCSGNVGLAPATCTLCETLANSLRRYLQTGDVVLTADIMDHLGSFCEKQLARLVGDCACDKCICCPDALRQAIGPSASQGGRGQLFATLYLFEASVLLYRRKQHASCSHRGFTFGIPTLMYNAVSALHAQVFDAGLGELPAKVQQKIVELSGEICQPPVNPVPGAVHADDSDLDVETGEPSGHKARRLSMQMAAAYESYATDDEDDDVRTGNNLVNSSFRAVLAVLELARAVDANRATRQSESQPMLLRQMLASQKRIRALERSSSQNLTHREDSVSMHGPDTARGRHASADLSEHRVFGRRPVEQQRRDEREKYACTQRALFGLVGAKEVSDAEEQAAKRKGSKNKWSMNADENPFYSKLRGLCCQVVRLGVGKAMRLKHDVYSQHSAIRASLRLLSSMGPDMLMARKMQEMSPTANKKFVASLIRCIKWHPYWTHYQSARKDELIRCQSLSVDDGERSPVSLSGAASPTSPSSIHQATTQMANLLAVEACKLIQQLSTHLSQRHLMVFPDTARKLTGSRKGRGRLQSPSDDLSDDNYSHIDDGYDNENDEAMRKRSKNGCLPILSLLAGAGRGDLNISVRSAAVAALKEIASNSTICSEAICAHDGVKQLVTAAHVGDHPLRRNVALIFSLIAMTPSIREQLLKNYQALLLLLQLQALRDNPYFDDDAQVVAYAAKALKYLSPNSALVYLEALKIGVARVDAWNQSDDHDHVCSSRTHVTTTVGVALLGPGYQELLQLALNGLGDAAAHADMADVLIANEGIESLLDCLQIRDAKIIYATVRTLAALVNQVVAFERRRRSSMLVCRVIDRLLLLVWPYAHRAARTLQSLCRQKNAIREQGAASSPLDLTLVPVSSGLVGLAATAIERVARDHGLGDYLVHHGALDALIARLTPDGYKEDEEECMRLYASINCESCEATESKSRQANEMATGTAAAGSTSGSQTQNDNGNLKEEPPILRVLSAIAQLAHNTPHCLPAGRVERTLSIVHAFHHNKRCRHLAMLALWRIRPVAADGADPPGLTEAPQELYQEGQESTIAPPPPIYWNEDDVITWLGCIGFGLLGKVMRRYLAQPQPGSSIEILNSLEWTKSRQQNHIGWTRGRVDKAQDPYGQATAGEKLLALTSADLQVGGCLRLTETLVKTLELSAFASELRELHLRMREASQPHAYDVRVPVILLESSEDDDWELAQPPGSGPSKHMETEVVLRVRQVRRYRALYAEASEILAASDERSGSDDIADLVQDVITDAKRAYDAYLQGDVQGARVAALMARTNAGKVKDAVALNRVKLAVAREADDMAITLEDVGDMLLGAVNEPETLRWGDTLWYELSSAATVDIFNVSRSIGESNVVVQQDGAIVSSKSVPTLMRAPTLQEPTSPGSPNGDESRESAGVVDIEEVCLWPTEGAGSEAARVREHKRKKRTPTGVLQKVSKAPIRDKRGIAHLFEVRFIDARVLLPGGRTALMMCAKEGDLTMVQLLLDNVEIHLNERLAPTMLDMLRQNMRRRQSRSFHQADAHQSDPCVFEVLDAGARPSAIDEHGNTALHHALRSLLRGVEKLHEGAAVNPEHLFSRIEVVDTLLQRIALPHSASVFSHGAQRRVGLERASMFAESYRGLPMDALALAIRCYGNTQRKVHLSEQNVSDETNRAGYPQQGLETLAEKIDDLVGLMFRCGFTLTTAAIREAERVHLLARLRYLYVENCELGALETLLREVPDIFLKRNLQVKSQKHLEATPILPKAYTMPWEAPVFALKRLQQMTQKVWMSQMVFHVNRQLLMYVVFIVMVLYVAADVVGMDLFLVSRDAFQQALRTRLVEEEWYPMNGFLEVATPEDWWKWAEGPLLDAVYEPTLPRWNRDGTLSSRSNGAGTYPLLGGLGMALGQPRLRMVATQPDRQYLGACAYDPGHARLGREDDACFSYFGLPVQLDRTLESSGALDASVLEALDFKKPAKGWLEIDAPSVYGYQAYYPGSSGYVASLPKDEAVGRALIESLKNVSWVSQNTRAIMLEFMAYSASDHHSHNLVTQVRLVAEFTPTGAVMCSGRIRAVRLFLYKTARDYFRLVLEFGWLVGCLFLFRSEVQQMAAAFERDATPGRSGKFQSFVSQLQRLQQGISNYAVAHFNIFDLAQFHTFGLMLGAHASSIAFAMRVDWNKLAAADDTDRESRRNLSTASVAIYLAEIRLTLLGLYVLLSFLKLLDRMRVRESLHVLIVEEMFKKIFTFLIVMTICVLAFSFTAFFSRLGGAQGPMGGQANGVGGGEAFLSAAVSQMRQLIGEIDYETAYNSDPRFGIIFCVVSFLVLPVLLMNLLIAIMLEAYESVRGAAAARYCYLQLVAHSDYFKAHETGEVPTTLTHWVALCLGAAFFPLLVLERLVAVTRRGLHFVVTDVFYPERRARYLQSISSDDEPSVGLQTFVRVLRNLAILNKLKLARVHPST